MKEPIGEIIRESVKRSGLTQEEFAKEMGMTLRNLANLFNKQRLPIEQVVRASKILKEDFIERYTDILYDEDPGLSAIRQAPVLREPASGYEATVHKEPILTFSLNIKGEAGKISEKFPELLNVIKSETEARGLQLG
ncbi:MAG TPA: helix-turn-helix transcriptional regulator [Parapedobacter sp.]|uniref:helix-turn-helix transcriptional regulator n=1 Tax=Parapedobacter sp. TaxID=1958893 RepID=UPI002B80A2A9|nr:helix-turn-helix transcriptional regulator [Parapedobacter sp.]HWK58705.1 helix-turn-helix transcriptional regulator [Parapedobacter sp.]